MKTLPNRPPNELTRQVYNAMRDDPSPGDWCEMVDKDMEHINIHMDEGHIRGMTDGAYKQMIKSKVRADALREFETSQSGPKKTQNIQYDNLESPQEYLLSSKFNNEMRSVLYNLRCRTLKNFQRQFS